MSRVKRARKSTEISFTLQRPNIRLSKMLWQFHPQDDDPFPSVPHGHSLDPNNRYKLDVFTGDVIDVSTKVINGSASEKELTDLYNDKGFRRVAVSAISYYLNKQPEANLSLLPLMEQVNRRSHSSMRMGRMRNMAFRGRDWDKFTKYLSIHMSD